MKVKINFARFLHLSWPQLKDTPINCNLDVNTKEEVLARITSGEILSGKTKAWNFITAKTKTKQNIVEELNFVCVKEGTRLMLRVEKTDYEFVTNLQI